MDAQQPPARSEANSLNDTRTSQSLRSAFLVVAELVWIGKLDFDLSNKDWPTEFEMTVVSIAEVLESHR